MLNIGGGELVIIALVALLVIPPQKIPQVATSLGRFFSQMQRGFNELKTGFHSSMREVNRDINRQISTPAPPPPKKQALSTTPSPEKEPEKKP